MKAISRALDRFCYNHPRLGIPQLMKYIALGNVAVFIADMLMNGLVSYWIAFVPELILRGQIWRLVTFVFVPVSSGGYTIFGQMFFFALATFFYYWIGTALERQWGTTRFTVFYGLGVILNIVAGFVIYAVLLGQLSGAGMSAEQARSYLQIFPTISMTYVNMSLFFSFATLYPDMQVLLYGIIPLKVKWLAWLDVLFFAWSIGSYLLDRQWAMALAPVIAILNYLIFFWEDLARSLRLGGEKVRHRTSPQTINFKKAQKEIREKRGYLHKCAVCGITDADDPDMEFRYCSKCNGYYCYCANHINNHTHVQ